MAMTKIIPLCFLLAVYVSSVAAQFDLIGFGGFGGKPFGKPGLGGLGKPGFGGLGGLGGLGKPGKPGGFGLGGGLFDLYRTNGPEDTVDPYYNWQNPPAHN